MKCYGLIIGGHYEVQGVIASLFDGYQKFVNRLLG
jgi:hypothetical protein